MSRHKILKEVNDFLTSQRIAWLHSLHRSVQSVCENISQVAPKGYIVRVYGRDTKQEGNILKDNAKIAEKILKKRESNKNYSIRDVGDLVGFTVVVQYSDQIDEIIEILSEMLKGFKIEISKSQKIEDGGYYATHIDLVSKNPDYPGVCGELQVKTLLHDAWSIKMHDLNYKPAGEMDSRLDSIFRSMAMSLEAIEKQSEIIRDMIMEKWNTEERWRNISKKRMFEGMHAMINIYSEEEISLKNDIESLDSNEFVEKEKIDEIHSRILKVVEEDSRKGWMMSVHLALFTKQINHVNYAIVMIQDWISELIQDRSKLKAGAEAWFVPLACMALGDIELAIRLSERIIVDLDNMSDRDRMIAQFNLANALVEREFIVPSRPGEARLIQEKLDELLIACAPLRNEDASGFDDLDGLMQVAFASLPDDVRGGMELIERGWKNAPSDELDIAKTFYELHMRMAWRKLLRLEDLEMRHKLKSL